MDQSYLRMMMKVRHIDQQDSRTGHGHCMGRLRPSCVRLVYFLRKSTKFHVKQTECQRILLLAIAKCCPLSYSLHNHSPITPQSNYASVYPPSFDTLEWMDMQIGLPLSGLMKLFHRTYSLPQRLQN